MLGGRLRALTWRWLAQQPREPTPRLVLPWAGCAHEAIWPPPKYATATEAMVAVARNHPQPLIKRW
jgi:hypothetical protein